MSKHYSAPDALSIYFDDSIAQTGYDNVQDAIGAPGFIKKLLSNDITIPADRALLLVSPRVRGVLTVHGDLLIR